MITIETPMLSARKPRVTKWRLALESYLAVVVVIVLGVMASAPAIYGRVRYFYETTYTVGGGPADETQLRSWAMAQPGVVSFLTERKGPELRIRSEYHGSAAQQPPHTELVAQMRTLGYDFQGMHGGASGLASGIGELLTNPVTLAAMLVGMQAAMAVVGLSRIRAAKRRGDPVPALIPGNYKRALLVGSLGGLGLLGLGLLNQYVLTAWLGHAAPSPWDSSHTMSGMSKMVFLLFGSLGAPVAEEIFFRGYLFGKFRGAGYLRFGAFVTSLLFAAVHFSDGYNVPCIFLFGLCLAALYQRTGSLLAPMAAHMINNGTAILWLIRGG